MVEPAILEVIRDYLCALQQRGIRVSRAVLYGSWARGEAGPESDIDLLVEFDQARKTFDNFMHLSFLLEELLQRRVEIVTPEALSPYIGPHIMEEIEYADFSGVRSWT